MMVRQFPAFLALFTGALLLASPLSAAEFTGLYTTIDVDEDEEHPKVWNLSIEPTFRFDYTTAEITREAPCVPREVGTEERLRNPRLIGNRDRCDSPTIVDNQELFYRHTRSALDLTLRFSVLQTLEFRLTAPYVFSHTRGLRYADGVTAMDSSVDPTTDRVLRHANEVFQPGMTSAGYVNRLDQYQEFRFFEVPDDRSFRTYERSGFDDPTVGLTWAPWNDYRDDTKATMIIGMDYTMPVTAPQRPDNSAVGRGVHELQWTLGASRKFGWFEPYFGAQYFLPLPAQGSLYGQVDPVENRGQGQVLRNPPQRGLFTVGTELIAFEDRDRHIRHAFDLRFQFGYTSEGRDYTPLFDHMTDPNNPCNGLSVQDVRPQFNENDEITNPDQVACAWVVRQPSNAGGRNTAVYDLADAIDRGDSTPYAFTDLMSVDSYGVFGGQLGVYLQPSQYFQFRGVVGLTHHQGHLITNARTGRAEERGTPVSMTNPRERNPAYNPSYDNSGNRFKVERHNTWHFMVTTSLQF